MVFVANRRCFIEYNSVHQVVAAIRGYGGQTLPYHPIRMKLGFGVRYLSKDAVRRPKRRRWIVVVYWGSVRSLGPLQPIGGLCCTLSGMRISRDILWQIFKSIFSPKIPIFKNCFVTPRFRNR